MIFKKFNEAGNLFEQYLCGVYCLVFKLKELGLERLIDDLKKCSHSDDYDDDDSDDHVIKKCDIFSLPALIKMWSEQLSDLNA